MFSTRFNGWAALAVINGVDVVSNQISNSLSTISVICGLLLSTSVPLLFSPASNVVDLEHNNTDKICYLVFVGISVISHFCSLLSGCLLVFFFFLNNMK